MKIDKNQKFESRKAIQNLLGGNTQKGITKSSNTKAILLFINEEELYTDSIYRKDNSKYLLYTGIGRTGHQDSLKNKNYHLNMAVLTHKANGDALLVFVKKNSNYVFQGCFELIETHQNFQIDDLKELRRVFVFHLQKIADDYIS